MQRDVRVGVGVFVVRDGRFLMGRRGKAPAAGSWSLPGGHIEFGETFEQAARREVAEETGAILGDVTFCALTNDIHTGEGLHYISIWVAAELTGGDVTVLEPDKLADLSWFSVDSLPQPLFPPWRELLASPFLPAVRRQLGAPLSTSLGES